MSKKKAPKKKSAKKAAKKAVDKVTKRAKKTPRRRYRDKAIAVSSVAQLQKEIDVAQASSHAVHVEYLCTVGGAPWFLPGWSE